MLGTIEGTVNDIKTICTTLDTDPMHLAARAHGWFCSGRLAYGPPASSSPIGRGEAGCRDPSALSCMTPDVVQQG